MYEDKSGPLGLGAWARGLGLGTRRRERRRRGSARTEASGEPSRGTGWRTEDGGRRVLGRRTTGTRGKVVGQNGVGDGWSCVISVFAQRTRQLSLAQACPVTWRRRLWRSSRRSDLCSSRLLALSGATPHIILRPHFAARRVCKVTAYRYGMVFQKA